MRKEPEIRLSMHTAVLMRDARILAGLTKEKAADKLGVKKSVLKIIERHEVPYVSVDILAKAAKLYHCPDLTKDITKGFVVPVASAYIAFSDGTTQKIPFGIWLKKVRVKEKKISVETCAARIGISSDRLKALENGDVQPTQTELTAVMLKLKPKTTR